MRVPVEPRRTYKLLNHGPTTLVTSAAAGRRNIMAAAWVMPIDFEPPKVAAVISSETYTRELVESSGEFVLSVPTVAMAELTYAVGHESGRDVDKFAKFDVRTAPASKVAPLLVEGCVAWLECRVAPERDNETKYDLFIAEVVAAWAEDEVFQAGTWRFTRPEHRTIHHIARGVFFASGDVVDGGATRRRG